MPRSTAKFNFEFKMMSWAIRFSEVMAGENRGFLMILDVGGAVRQLFLGEGPLHFDLRMKRSLTKSKQCWLFYHPFDAPEYTWMEWQNVQRDAIERLMGERFEDTDFVEYLLGKGERIEFPASWGVMF